MRQLRTDEAVCSACIERQSCPSRAGGVQDETRDDRLECGLVPSPGLKQGQLSLEGPGQGVNRVVDLLGRQLPAYCGEGHLGCFDRGSRGKEYPRHLKETEVRWPPPTGRGS